MSNTDVLPINVKQNEPLAPAALFARHAKDRLSLGEGPILYIDLARITSKFKELGAAFPKNTDVHYAMKCNPTPAVLRHIHSLGGNFEIASYAELQDLQQALREGNVSETDIASVSASTLFSNPVKSRKNIIDAFAGGVRYFAFEGKNELQKIAACAPGAAVYLRLATPVGQSEVASESKFGMLVTTSGQQRQVADLLSYAKTLGLVPYGLTFHVGSQMEHTHAWDRPLQHCGAILEMLTEQGIQLQMLDIGGGYPAYHNKRIPSLKAFGAAIRKGLEHLPYQPKKLAIEPGRALVSDAGAMVATVIGTDIRGNSKRKWVYLNVGAFNGLMEALETNTQLRFPVADELASSRTADCVLTGPSCDGQDTITNSQFLSADIADGDRLIFYTAGAYTTAYASRFNGFDVPAVQII